MFKTFFESGFEHILDINAYDHVIFIISICLLANFKSWRKLLILITAFTIGHSLTLALSALDILKIPSIIIESVIPITIIFSALDNIYQSGKEELFSPKYLLVLVFGFIHGMGFSNYFKALLGKEENITGPLFAFNVGVEVAQLCIVALTLIVLFILNRLGVKQKYPTIIGSSIIIIISVYLLIKVLAKG